MADKPKRAWRIVHAESSTGWGGQEHRVMAELSGFQRRGSKVWLLAPRTSQIYRRAAGQNMAVQPLALARWQFPAAVVRASRLLRHLKPDVLNTHSSRDGWLAGLAGRLARVPFVVRSRHIDVSYPNRWISRHAYATLADHVITTSERISAHLRERFQLPASRVSTVPTGIELELFSPTGPRAELLPPSGEKKVPLVGMVSVLRSWKGHSTFLQAARQLRDERFSARFVIVGEGPCRPGIEKMIAELRLADTVALIGHREDVPAVLRSLEALVIASTAHEGVPQIGLQALATRTPVIGSDAGGTQEIIRPGETGRIFPAGDAAALAQAIRDTLSDTTATEALLERGWTMVQSHHSLNGMLDTLDRLYSRHLPA